MKAEVPFVKPIGQVGTRMWKLPRGQFGLLLAAMLLSFAAGYAGYQRYIAAAQAAPTVQVSPARLGSLISSVSATGSVVPARQAKLAFPSSGKLIEMDVNVGDSVKAGQTLAKIDPQPLQINVNNAQSLLNIAQIKLQQLKDGAATTEDIAAARAAYDAAVAKYGDTVAGATAADLQAAQSAVDQANATQASAQAKLDQTKAGATSADMAAAQAGVDQGRASLNSAKVKLDQLQKNTFTPADWAAAQVAVDSDTSALKTAEAKLAQTKAGATQSDMATAQASVDQVKQALTSAEDKYQMAQGNNLKDSGFTSVSAAQQSYNAAKANYDAAVQKLHQLQAGPLTADLQAAQTAVDQAQGSLKSSQAKLDLMKQGPLPTDMAAAQAGVDQATATMASAQAKLDQLKAGPADADVVAGQSTVDQAKASLASAQAKLDQVNQGPTATDVSAAKSGIAGAKAQVAAKANPPKDTDVALAQEQVNQAQSSLDQTNVDLANATLVAPFDGVVSAVTPNVGELAGSTAGSTAGGTAGSTASGTAVVTLEDPKSVRIDATVDETDVTKMAVGQQATVTFDALPDQQLQGKVISVAPSGTTSQGVVSYLISVGINALDKPLPAGMSATLSIVTDRKDNVLLVPNRAIRTQGGNKVVDVMTPDKKTETRSVQTGTSNDQSTQIVSGLQEGNQVVIPATSTRAPNVNVGAPGIGGGGGGGGGNFPPGGR